MRKRYFVLAMSIAAAMMAGGCSKGASDTNPTNNTEAAQTETEAQQESSSMSDSEKASYYASENSQEEDLAQGPVKVEGTITQVGEDSITVDSNSETGYIGEMVLMIDPDSTLVLDGVNGLPVQLSDVQLGTFEAYLGPAMTMSLPPQTTPYAVIVNIPEGQTPPQYVVAAGKVDDVQGRQTLTGVDESQYTLARSVDVQPFLTKNIVKLEDIDTDSRCLVWMNDEGDVDRIVLFGE